MAYLGEDIKKLGFGLMRLPRKFGKIDINQTKKMVDMYLDAGFTYFDTAFVYLGSENAIRKALVERYPRESFQLATKNAAWLGCKTQADAIKQFEFSLKKTGAGYFDFYLLHNLGGERTKIFDDLDLWNWAFEKKKEGLIKHVGFSAHSTPEELDEILTKHPEAEFVQLQINYADWENPLIASRKCYEIARKHNKPVIIMEPVKGGLLAKSPESISKILHDADPTASDASWAIRFAAGLDGVITVLSGMSNIAQMKDNLSYMTNFTSLSDEECETISKVQAELAKLHIVPCTSCNYCSKVCPKNIGISGSFAALNYYTLYQNKKGAKKQFKAQDKGKRKAKATDCIKCGKCEKACPQHIEIRKELDKVTKAFY